ncbi:MAG: winged helix DNA-binding domain-containing protein [Spirochaetaceae bacterium]|nr:winged helix DNA-binding domain-containing protein [Spirochaetaceae bacterium]
MAPPTARRRIDVAERRARLAVRQHLATPAPDVTTAAADLVGLHSSDPVSVYLSAWSRVSDFKVADMEGALYEQRSVVRLLGMRRTMFVVPRDLAAVIDAACTRALAPAERRRLLKLIGDQGIDPHPDRWLSRVMRRTLSALGERGQATAKELTAAVPELTARLSFGEGRTWAGTVGLSTRLLFLLATEARIVRGRPRGTWISSQYRWAATADWLDGGLPAMEPEEARAELVRRWLEAFGPGTLTDLAWWTGWPQRQTRHALAAAGAVEVDLDTGTGYALAEDLEPVAQPDGWVALLPALDPTVMGWKERSWYLGDHQELLFDRNGNAGPTVWADGRIVGGWAQRADGTIAVELLESVLPSIQGTIAAEAERLRVWLAGTVITPRFRTPLEKRLTSTP